MHRTIQNCSICFLSVGPNNSARSPTHTSETAQFFFWRKWLYAAAGSSLDWLAQKGTRCHFVTCWLQEVFRHPPQCVMEINLFRPKRKVNGETPKRTIMSIPKRHPYSLECGTRVCAVLGGCWRGAVVCCVCCVVHVCCVCCSMHVYCY